MYIQRERNKYFYKEYVVQTGLDIWYPNEVLEILIHTRLSSVEGFIKAR